MNPVINPCLYWNKKNKKLTKSEKKLWDFASLAYNGTMVNHNNNIYISRNMGAHVSKIKHLKLDQWEDAQVIIILNPNQIGVKYSFIVWWKQFKPCLCFALSFVKQKYILIWNYTYSIITEAVLNKDIFSKP